MALQIEAPETIRLIEDLARCTGEGPETVVRVAVQERLARLRTPEEEAERRARVYEIVRELQAAFKEHPEAIVDHGELLYGEDGLPR
ncbi:MAG: type II toxin-antitoxin system VapB family antitoxin [Thermomicrobiales bacterium]|nr:type II toxin-antitoxin system VapB family antitoxin [Thermomicrobiales bacterium]